MNDSRVKWLFFLFCSSLLSFILGWWIHDHNTKGILCTTGCLIQEGTEDSGHVTTTQCPPCHIIAPINSTTKNNVNDNLPKLEHSDTIIDDNNNSNLPTIFMITPTYARPTQKADLTRLCQTLMHVKNLYWIIVEDANEKTPIVTNYLKRCRVQSVQLNRKTSLKLQPKKVSHKAHKNRGAEQRNIGLDWLRENFSPNQIRGVVYFGDDDNTYDIQLFEEMRYTKKVSIWPVGLAGGLKAEGPVCKNGKVVSWHVGWSPNRKFPVDMAAFAVNVNIILLNHKIRLDPFGPGGQLEPIYLSQVTTVEELEARADDCTKVYVWHTQTKGANLRYEQKLPTTIEVYVWHTQTKGAYLQNEKKFPTTLEVKK